MPIDSASVEVIHKIFLECNQKICTDTRKIIPGSIFFALSGENFDGNKFAVTAIENGCSYAVIDKAEFAVSEKFILVDNVITALQKLAKFHRAQFSTPVIAITGSNGKTTTKELLYEVLSKKYKTLATIGNLNNHIGVPLTLLRLDATYEMAIIEMGANHQGEISLLSSIAQPDYGIITNIGKAHLEGFGGIEGVKKGKGELFDYIKLREGLVFYHADDQILSEISSSLEKKITYGTNKLYDIVGSIASGDRFIEFKWKTRYNALDLAKAQSIKTHLIGRYNYFNLLCAAAVGNYFKVDEDLINEAISNYVPTNNRSQFHSTENNKFVLDMYNANPSSMQAAIDNFFQIKADNKILILGDMLELGSETDEEHKKVILLASEKSIECFFVGKNFYKFKNEYSATFFIDSIEAQSYFTANKLRHKTILIKGSRGIKLEELLPALS